MGDKIPYRIILALLFFGFFLQVSFADGPPHDENNRYTGGKVTVLKLTEKQIKILNSRLESKEKEDEEIVDPYLELTPQQTALLKKDTGYAPTRLEVWETRKGMWDCTCNAANLGFRFSEDRIEVPHEYLMSDEEAEKIWNSLEE